MNISEFAKAIGRGNRYVRNRVETGEIPAVETVKGNKTFYDIDPALVNVWRDEAVGKHTKKSKAFTKGYNAVRKRNGESRLMKATRKLKEINKKYGLSMSYGEAVAKGYIEDEDF